MSILLEVCVDSPAGLAAAIEGGASRIELCSALDVGGLTPSPGLIALAARAPVPIHAMIRPRIGSFVFGRDDETAMRADMDAVLDAGLAGVVIGASRDDGSLDTGLLARLRAAAGPAAVTLHRAFDLVPDMETALEQAIDLGIERILTSGGKPSAVDGASVLAALAARSAGRIGIMPGSGLRPENVETVLCPHVREVHASCRRAIDMPGNDLAVAFGFQPPTAHVTDLQLVRRMRARLDELA